MLSLDQAILLYIDRYSDAEVVFKILFKLNEIFPKISYELIEILILNYDTFYKNHNGHLTNEDKITCSHLICTVLIEFIIKKKIKQVKETTGKDFTSKVEAIIGCKIE